MQVLNSIADLREVARKRVPRAIFQYLDHGSYDEVTLRRNRSDLEALRFRQRVLIDVTRQSLQKDILGVPANMPVVLAPCGLTGLVHRDGEILAARAAQDFGVPLCLSTVSVCSIEDVRAATTAPFWFQLYVMKDRAFIERDRTMDEALEVARREPYGRRRALPAPAGCPQRERVNKRALENVRLVPGPHQHAKVCRRQSRQLFLHARDRPAVR